MRILHIGKYYTPYVGGTELYTQELVRYQSSRASVSVIVANVSASTTYEGRDNAALIRVPRFGVLSSMPVTPTLALHIRRAAADIVHLHLPNPAAALAYLASGHRGKLILTHHADTVGRAFLRKLGDPFVRRTMRRASRIIVTTQSYLNSSDELGEFRDKCRIIPLGINPEKFAFASCEEASALRKKYGSRILLCLGRFVEFKGFEYAIRSLSHVDGTLLMAGRGVAEEALRRTATECGVADRVHFLGAVPNDKVPGLLKAASVLLFPSVGRTESFGYSQLEAMAAGVPVINTSIPSGAAEVSVHGVTGFTVPPRDAVALANAARVLLSDEALRQTFGAAGQQRVRERFTLRHMAEQTFDLYREALAVRPCRCGVCEICERQSMFDPATHALSVQI